MILRISKCGMELQVIVLILSAFILSACVGGDRVGTFPPYKFRGEDITKYLSQHYPSGTDQAVLIKDFTEQGYRYVKSNNRAHKELLVFPSSCKFYFTEGIGSDMQLFFEWSTDADGKIITMDAPTYKVCN